MSAVILRNTLKRRERKQLISQLTVFKYIQSCQQLKPFMSLFTEAAAQSWAAASVTKDSNGFNLGGKSLFGTSSGSFFGKGFASPSTDNDKTIFGSAYASRWKYSWGTCNPWEKNLKLHLQPLESKSNSSRLSSKRRMPKTRRKYTLF